MSIWQYMSAIDGFIKANSPDSGKSLSDAEKDALWDYLEAG